jgi:hypothetical protein
MTKKHFIALADALRATQPPIHPSKVWMQWAKDRNAIADVCQKFNGNFKSERWFDYIDGECGPNGGKL